MASALQRSKAAPDGAPAPDVPSERWQLKDGRHVILRAARSEDANRIQSLVASLSPRTRYMRFFNPLRELPPALLDTFTHADPRHDMTLLAFLDIEGRQTLIGMGQYFSEDFRAHCEFALLVADGYQGSGLGTRLLRNLVCIAVEAGIEIMEGDVLDDNLAMRQVAQANGFALSRHAGEAYLLKLRKTLAPPPWKCSQLATLAKKIGH
jgi:acetyltransferase